MNWFHAFCAAASCAAIFSAVGRAAAAELKAGDKAPDFTLPGSDGKTYHLADFHGKQAVVLAWFPKAFTPGCTAECKSFRASGDALRKFEAAYFTASRDTAEKNRKFAESLAVDYPILSDPAGDVAGAYGVIGRVPARAAAVDVLHRQGREDSLHRQGSEDGDPRGRRGGEAEGIGRRGAEGALSVPRVSPRFACGFAINLVPRSSPRTPPRKSPSRRVAGPCQACFRPSPRRRRSPCFWKRSMRHGRRAARSTR